MSDSPLHILLIAVSESEETDCLARIRQREAAFERVRADDPARMFRVLGAKAWDAIFYSMGKDFQECLTAIGEIRQFGYHGPLIVLGPESCEERAIRVIKAGADEFLSPPRWPLVESVLREELASAGKRRCRQAAQREEERKNRQAVLARVFRHIAHEFNNMLTVVLGNLMLLRSLGQLPPEAENYLSATENACRRIGTLTHNLFAVAKGPGSSLAAVSLSDIIRAACEKARVSFSDDRWSLDLELASGDMIVSADRDQIQEVIGQLLANAFLSMPDGGNVRISLTRREITAEQCSPVSPGIYFQVEVVDQGPGMPSEIADRVFEPFFTTRKNSEGLGLALANTIIQKHGGHLFFDTFPGQGSRFSFLLPTGHRVKETPATTSPRQKMGNGHRILIMDDEASIRELLGFALQEKGFEVGLAPDGESAIRLIEEARARSRPFAVAVLDLNIPGGMGGREVLKKLRAIDPSMRTIISSGYSDLVDPAEARKEGFDAAIGKPYDLEEMFHLIEKMKDPPLRN